MTTPTIHGDVTVTVTSSVAADLITCGGIGPGDAYCWRLPDGSQTTDPRTALTDALLAAASGSSEPTPEVSCLEPSAHTSAKPAIGGDVTLIVPASLGVGLLEYAGLEHTDDGTGWRTRDGREHSNPAVALTDALVAIAEDDLAAEFVEADKED